MRLCRCSVLESVQSGKSSRRGRRYPAGAHTVAVSASLRLRCDARPGVGVAELAARPEGRSVQTAATSQFTKRASAPAPRPSIAAATEIGPRRVPPAARRRGGRATVERQPSLLQRRVRAGRGASLRGAWVCLISWPRAALRELTRRTCLNGAALGREASCATGHEIKQTQGSRCEAPTALSMRRGLPGHDFAACLCCITDITPDPLQALSLDRAPVLKFSGQ